TATALTKKLTLESFYAAVFAAVVGTVAYGLLTAGASQPISYTSALGGTFTVFYTRGAFCRFGSAERAGGDESESDPRQ
ncbi:MAG: hypothetical protein ABEI99_05085, partial [Halobaculum sp.]